MKLKHGEIRRLAFYLKCSSQTISNILNGRTRLISEDYAKRLAEFMQCSVSEIAVKVGDKYNLKNV